VQPDDTTPIVHLRVHFFSAKYGAGFSLRASRLSGWVAFKFSLNFPHRRTIALRVSPCHARNGEFPDDHRRQTRTRHLWERGEEKVNRQPVRAEIAPTSRKQREGAKFNRQLLRLGCTCREEFSCPSRTTNHQSRITIPCLSNRYTAANRISRNPLKTNDGGTF
jgi:hypothetical protein